MNASRLALPRTAAALTFVLAASACAEDAATRATGGSGGARSVVPQVVVSVTEGVATLTLSADLHGDLRRVASFTGRLQFDPAKLAFDSEVEQQDGALRAANPMGGTIRVAGASQTGFDPARLAVFRFRVLDPAGLQSVEFQLDELHDVAREDLKGIVRRGDGPRILR